MKSKNYARANFLMRFRMSNLNQIIDFTKLFQDVELATAVQQLKQDPAQLQQFLQSQQTKVYQDVVKQKESTFQKVYGDLGRASQAQEAVLMYDKRNKELADIQQKIYNNQKSGADAVINDKSLAGRKYEMNEWSVNNKKDTLFVFSWLFIVLSVLVLITVLLRMGLLSTTLWVAIAAPVIIVFILILVDRSQYTNIFRNKRYWNRRIFEGKYGKIPIPLCSGAISGLESDFSSVQQGIQGAVQNAAQGIASTTQSVANNVNAAAQNVSAMTKTQ
jgi:ABC-type multidrug transport system fused ATPase/permease subunit